MLLEVTSNQMFVMIMICPPSPLPWLQDPYAELAVFVDKAGVDGLYTSCPDLALRFQGK